MFGTQAKANYDGLSIPTLEPGKYENVVLKDVVCEQLAKQDGTVGKWAIKFTFETTDGKLHQHTEYELSPQLDGEKFASKWKNQDTRVGHILSKFVAKEQLTQNATSWEQYGKWVVQTLKNANHTQVKLDMLVTGSVYQGKAKSEFTGYPPFVAKHGDKLQFDNNGLAGNKAFFAHQAQASNAAPDADGGANAGGAGYASAGQAQADF